MTKLPHDFISAELEIIRAQIQSLNNHRTAIQKQCPHVYAGYETKWQEYDYTTSYFAHCTVCGHEIWSDSEWEFKRDHVEVFALGEL